MKFEIKKSKNGQFYFNLLARNNKVVATSEMYTRKENALKTARLIAEETYSGIIDYTVDEDGVESKIKDEDNAEKVYVIMNDSYGEVIGITRSDETRREIMREELEKYNTPEEYIESILNGEEDDGTVYYYEDWLS